MSKQILPLIILTLISFQALAQQDSSEEIKVIYPIEDFEGETKKGLPVAWYNQKGEKKPYNFDNELRNTYKYHVISEGDNSFLRFEGQRGKHLNYPLINKEGVNIYKTPILAWDWRILDLPEGANEDTDNNDVAASIYVVFDMGRVLFKRVPKSIRYTWSSTLPKGTELSKFFGNQKIVVVGTGEEKLGEWQSFERNIVEDYKRLFGDDPPETPIAILILSDGNDTEDGVKADYDNILLKED